MDKPFQLKFMTGVVDLSKAPPVATLEGYPALPGESAYEYGARLALIFGVSFERDGAFIHPDVVFPGT